MSITICESFLFFVITICALLLNVQLLNFVYFNLFYKNVFFYEIDIIYEVVIILTWVPFSFLRQVCRISRDCKLLCVTSLNKLLTYLLTTYYVSLASMQCLKTQQDF